MTGRDYTTHMLALAASAVAGGLAITAFFLLLWPETVGALLNAGGFTVLSEAQEAVYPLVNDALRNVLRRMEDHEPFPVRSPSRASRNIPSM
jgi:hypothetical protein